MKKSKRIVFCFKRKNVFSFEKNGPNEFKYGFDSVSKHLASSLLFAGNYKLHHLPWRFLEKILSRFIKCGIYFQFYLNNKGKIQDEDLLFAINDGVGLGLLFFKLLGRFDNQVMVIIQGLHDRHRYIKNTKLLVYFYKRLLKKAELILTLSRYEKNLLIRVFGLNPKKVKVFYFGADKNYWKKEKVETNDKIGPFVLTVGSDMHRDYDLLLNDYHLKIPLKFVTRILKKDQLKKVKESPLFENYQGISNDKLRKLYSQSKFIIVPLKDTFATSGLSTTLQALAMGKPVLLAKTPVMEELFEDHKHVLYYKEGDSTSFRQRLEELNEDQKLREELEKNGRRLIEEKFNSEKMEKQVLGFIKKSLVNF